MMHPCSMTGELSRRGNVDMDRYTARRLVKMKAEIREMQQKSKEGQRASVNNQNLRSQK